MRFIILAFLSAFIVFTTKDLSELVCSISWLVLILLCESERKISIAIETILSFITSLYRKNGLLYMNLTHIGDDKQYNVCN